MSTEKLVITARLDIPNGSSLALDTSIPLGGFGKYSAVIAAGAGDFAIPLPWSDALAPAFLAIRAERPGLSYKLNDATSTLIHKLDGPLLLLGGGAVALLGAQPATLYFTNGEAHDIAVEILIGG